MKLWKEDLLENIFKITQMIVGIYCQSRDMEDFRNLQGNLSSVTLKGNLMEIKVISI